MEHGKERANHFNFYIALCLPPIYTIGLFHVCPPTFTIDLQSDNL